MTDFLMTPQDTIQNRMPPGQQLAAPNKWPTVGERAPRDDAAPWSLTVGGEVRMSIRLALDELQTWPATEQSVDIHCVTRWSKLDVRFSGVTLAALLDRAGPTASARYVSFQARSARGHSTSLPIADALQLNTLLAWSVDGQPLSSERGGPLRVIVPGRYFYKSLKWLETIELLADDRLGYWESQAGYHNTADPWLEQRYLAPGISRAQAQALLVTRDMKGRDVRGLRVSGCELAGLQAMRATLRDADFRECNLQGADFSEANLSNARFAGANLRNACFRGADLEGADFSGADLRGACLAGASLLGATFRHDQTTLDPTTEWDAGALADLAPAEQAFVQARAETTKG